MERCEEETRKMRDQFVKIRSSVTFQYRKEQDRLWTLTVQNIETRSVQWKPIQVQELQANIARLERARDLMTKELNTVLHNANTKTTDVEIISQSIRNGVLML